MPPPSKRESGGPPSKRESGSSKRDSASGKRDSLRKRWGHRRSNSSPIKPVPIDAMAAAAASGTRSRRGSPNATPRTTSSIEVVDEIEGLTALTMTSADAAPSRALSWINADLPSLFYAEGSSRLTKSSSEDQLNRNGSSQSSEDSKVLDYWRMEKALREAQIQVRQKQEEVEEMTSYKTAMEQEMADLQVTLFEEAHEMVRSEKEARHRDNCLLRDAQSRADLLTEEVKALKALVADHVVKRDPVPESSASSPPTSPVEVEKGNVDSILFNEFMKWHLNPSLDDSTDYMKRVLSEDITPCLRFHPGTMKISSAILKTMVDNALIIEAIPPGSEAAPACRLSKAKRTCTYRVKVRKKRAEGSDEETYEWIHVCTPTRDRIIAVANFYTYARYIVQGLVKSKITDVYWKLVELRLQVNKARLGMSID
eukprot:m.449220 g.449220  ORF g.449220 m.449220 type:complete len:426 (+) comp19787_c0_seq1:439-1716(+)